MTASGGMACCRMGEGLVATCSLCRLVVAVNVSIWLKGGISRGFLMFVDRDFFVRSCSKQLIRPPT